YIKRERGRGAGDRTPRDWTTFFTWARRDVSDDPFPSRAHIELVRRDIQTLRALPDVAEAENKIRSDMLRIVTSPVVRDTYESVKKLLQPQIGSDTTKSSAAE